MDNDTVKWMLGIVAICMFFPLISKLDLFGVKIELKEQVKELSNIVNALPDFVLGRYYEDDNDMQAAIDCYRKSISISRDFWPSWFAMGSLYHDYEAYIDNAFSCYKEVLKIDVDNVYAKVNMADLYITGAKQYRNIEEALELLKEALRTRPGMSLALYYKGEALNKLQQYDEALTCLDSIENSEEIEGFSHWLLLEKFIARSNKGEPITNNDIAELLKEAEDNDEHQFMVDSLHGEEKERFKDSDKRIIEHYLKKHKLMSSGDADQE